MPVALPLSILPLRCAVGFVCAALAASLAGCAAGPDYVRPGMAVPASYKEVGPWKPAQPKAVAGNLEWWRAYGDATLDDLAAQAVAANQSIRQAEAQYRQAQAVAAAVRASFWPSLGANAGADRALTNSSRNGPSLDTTYSVGLAAAWEPDLWGKLRRSVEAGTASSEASQADLAAARLSIVATLAQDYMQLRVTEMQSALYTQTLHDYERALALAKSQYAAGVALRSDVALAQNQLSATRAQALDLWWQRTQLEHAIADYDAAVAQYKQTVLGGFQEVEDNLAALRILAREIAEQEQAVESARLADSLAMAQYRAGTSTYLGVITAQTLTLSAERSLLQLRGRQLAASVALIKATGGGWSAGRPMEGDSSAAAGSKAAAPAEETKTVTHKTQLDDERIL